MPQMLGKPGPPADPKLIARQENPPLAEGVPARDQTGVAAVVTGERRENRGVLTMRPDRQHEGLIRPLHGQAYSTDRASGVAPASSAGTGCPGKKSNPNKNLCPGCDESTL